MNLFIQIFIFFYFLIISSHANENFTSKYEIEKIIEEYLLKNPQVLIESLENYRNKKEVEFEENKKPILHPITKIKIMKSFLTQEVLMLLLLLLNL